MSCLAIKALIVPALLLQPIHERPDIVQGTLVRILPSETFDFILEVIVIHFLVQFDKHLRPYQLVHKYAVGVVAIRKFTNFAIAD